MIIVSFQNCKIFRHVCDPGTRDYIVERYSFNVTIILQRAYIYKERILKVTYSNNYFVSKLILQSELVNEIVTGRIF